LSATTAAVRWANTFGPTTRNKRARDRPTIGCRAARTSAPPFADEDRVLGQHRHQTLQLTASTGRHGTNAARSAGPRVSSMSTQNEHPFIMDARSLTSSSRVGSTWSRAYRSSVKTCS
jgi:hypothetical protein